MIIGEADLPVHVLHEGADAADHDEQQQHTRGLRNLRCLHGDRARRQHQTTAIQITPLENELTNEATHPTEPNDSQSDHFNAFCLLTYIATGLMMDLRKKTEKDDANPREEHC